jgi:hypothetical protein
VLGIAVAKVILHGPEIGTLVGKVIATRVTPIVPDELVRSALKPATSNKDDNLGPRWQTGIGRILGNGLAMPKIHSPPHWPAIITSID